MVSQHPVEVYRRLGKYFSLKLLGLVGLPKLYLGGKLSNFELPNCVVARTISSSKYIHQAL